MYLSNPPLRPQVTLTDRELEVIRRIQAGAFPHPEFQAYPDYVDYFTHEKEVMPLAAGDEPKRRFIPSKVTITSTCCVVLGSTLFTCLRWCPTFKKI